MIKTGGQALIKALAAHGVEKIFCVAGESYLAALDALVDHPEIQVITCRHEGAACFMAEAYGKLTGKHGICFVTRGPGACNASIGVHTAKQDSTPLILFIGQVAREDRGREAFQEIEFAEMFGHVAKACLRIETANEAAGTVHNAFLTALEGRQGPVVVELPEDMLREEADCKPVPPAMIPASKAEVSFTNSLASVLIAATKPLVIIGGSGWSDDACTKFQNWAEAHGIPVAASFRRQDLIAHTSAVYVGELGTGPNPQLLEAVRQSDLILAIGTRLSEITTQGYTVLKPPNPTQKLVHVFPDVSELGRVYKPALSAALTPQALVESLPTLDKNWSTHSKNLRTEYLAWSDINAKAPDKFLVDIDGVYQTMLPLLPANTVITTDAGNFSGWTQRYIRYARPMRMLAPTSGAMGYGVPSAIAASIACPGRAVIGIMGDGGFMMSASDIATAMAYGANPVLLLFNNGIYGTIRMHQEMRYPGRTIATDLHNPDFAAYAKSFGANAFKITATSDFAPAFKEALQSKKLSVIELVTSPEQITTGKTLSMLGK